MRFKLLQVDTLFPVPLCSFEVPGAAARAGLALLFPGHLRHAVLPFHGDGDRISISFNASFRAKAAA